MSLVRRVAVIGAGLLAAACTSSTEGTASPESSVSASATSATSSTPPPAPRAPGGMFLDATAVEEAVAGQFEQREGVALDLSCDRRMPVTFGAEYRCEGTTADGEDVELLITVTDREGTYTWAEDD